MKESFMLKKESVQYGLIFPVKGEGCDCLEQKKKKKMSLMKISPEKDFKNALWLPKGCSRKYAYFLVQYLSPGCLVSQIS